MSLALGSDNAPTGGLYRIREKGTQVSALLPTSHILYYNTEVCDICDKFQCLRI